MTRWLFATALCGALASPAFGQGQLCRTSKPGTKSSYCASEEFMTQAFPSSATAGHVATFADSTGKVLADGGAAATTVNGLSGSVTIQGAKGINVTTSSPNVTVNRALNEATLQGNLSNPTGTNSASPLMMGTGSSCRLTPTYSGRVYVSYHGALSGSGSGTAGGGVQLRYGTGANPGNGDALTGTLIGNTPVFTVAATGASNTVPWELGGIITGLTPGTQIWIDFAVSSNAVAVTMSPSALSCSAFEF